MQITIAEIVAAEIATQTVKAKLKAIGREICKMREGEELLSAYEYEGYSRSVYGDPRYGHQEGPDWGLGTRIISIRFYWPRGGDTLCITIPESWLEADWRALESDRLQDLRLQEAEAEKSEVLRLEKEQDDNERAIYERLRAKFEGAR